MRRAAASLLAVAFAACAYRGTDVAAPMVRAVFLERDAKDGPWRPVADQRRIAELERLADNVAARFALALYAEAWRLAPPAGVSEPTLFVALQAGGNHARVGLDIEDAGRRRSLPAMPYLLLEATADNFGTTLLHETGHAVHALLAGPAGASEVEPIAPIPHSTAAVTDRRTAFNEGFGIHLETVLAHCAGTPQIERFYRLGPFAHPESGLDAEYYAPARDIMTYAQSRARYGNVRDGLYAFEPPPAGDYLRVQLDPARDLRNLRDAGSMVASEGFVASVLFHLIAGVPCDQRMTRYRPLLAALRDAERGASDLDTVPLIDLIATLRARDPALGAEAVRLFLDLSRGATVDPDAASLWARLFDAALAVDTKTRTALVSAIETRRGRWLAAALADPSVLARLVGPGLVVTVRDTKVGIAIFGDPQPLTFDVNAAGAPMWRLVPGVTPEAAEAIVAMRRKAPFASHADFDTRTKGLVPKDALSQ